SSRISFSDADQPAGGDADGCWFTMRSLQDYRRTYQTIGPNAVARTVFNIADSGVHKSDGVHSLININLHVEWFETWPKQYIICDKIELMSDADIMAPDPPSSLVAQTLSDSKIELNWQIPADNVGVAEYLIYMNGEVEGYSRDNHYTAVFLESGKNYHFYVTALDRNKNESVPSASVDCSTQSYHQSTALINPADLEYRGAFRLPDDFSWGGEAMSFCPNGDGGWDGSGAGDGYPGSLFVTNVNQREYGFVGEVSIPEPVMSASKMIDDLPIARVMKPPVDIRPANVNNWGDYIDIWRTGLCYQAEEKRLYSVWSVHYTVTGEKHAALSCCSAENLGSGVKAGAWYVGDPAAAPIDAMLGDYLFSTPADWAALNTAGKSLLTGRCRDGGLSGLGPTLYAVAPVGGATYPAPHAVIPRTVLLEYGPVTASDYYHFPQAIDGYLLSDSWRDAAWISSGKANAVMIMGNKACGENWYGYMGERMAHDWVIADEPYPEFYATDPDGKGWKAHRFIPMAVFYDPTELAQVAQGARSSYEPQPYGGNRFDPNLFFSAAKEIRTISYDAEHRHLYALEFDVERDGALIVHVWDMRENTTGMEQRGSVEPQSFILAQNYPNPFNGKTRIAYTLSAEQPVLIELVDLSGKRVGAFFEGRQGAGLHEQDLDLTHLPSGVFVLRFLAGETAASQKLVLVR
ncbi:MAG: T9SS C-terminal target domain-containing protein, partial [Calditrichaeota bacterium]